MKTDEEGNQNPGIKEFHTYNRALELTGFRIKLSNRK